MLHNILAVAFCCLNSAAILVLTGLFGLLFSDNKEPAFAALKMCQAMGAFTMFVTGPYVCTKVKILVVGSVLIIAMIGYALMEVYMKKMKAQNEDTCDQSLKVKKVPKGPTPL